MADHSKIEWTDATWNPITGCTLVDEGCRHCYAAHLITSWPAIGNHPSRKGLARKNAAGESKFTGEVRFNEQWIDQPLRWKKPRKIFVCAHGDLFHPAVPDEWIDKVFAVMALAPQHTFQVLTKRPDRAREYLTLDRVLLIGQEILALAPAGFDLSTAVYAFGDPEDPNVIPQNWPLPNVWLGTSISDQASADLRIPQLLATPAAVRFLSAEPLLGAVDIDEWLHDSDCADTRKLYRQHGDKPLCHCGERPVNEDRIDWIICGGESGPNARPMHPAWARSLRDQCAAAGVPFLFKQWGEWLPLNQTSLGVDDAYYHPAPASDPEASRRCKFDSLCIAPDGSAYSTGAANRIHHIAPGAFAGYGHMQSFRIGKTRAGRLLDGIEHNGFPGVAG